MRHSVVIDSGEHLIWRQPKTIKNVFLNIGIQGPLAPWPRPRKQYPTAGIQQLQWCPQVEAKGKSTLCSYKIHWNANSQTWSLSNPKRSIHTDIQHIHSTRRLYCYKCCTRQVVLLAVKILLLVFTLASPDYSLYATGTVPIAMAYESWNPDLKK